VLGVDGGNTKTVAVVARHDGRVLGQARGGATDIHAGASPEGPLAELTRVVSEAMGQASVTAQDIDATAFSLAGADWPEDFPLLEREIVARLGLGAPLVVNDALGALRSGSPDWTGIAVACGTYNAIGARQADGRIFHLGFWPDGVGGADLGSSALKAVYRAGLGLGPPTAMTAPVLAAYDAADWRALMHSFTRLEAPVSMRGVRSLAQIVLDAAEAGDGVARALVDRSADILAAQARVAANALDLPLQGLRLVLTGGVLQHPSALMADGIAARLPGTQPVRVMAPAVTGALLLAFDRAGAAMTADALAGQLDQ